MYIGRIVFVCYKNAFNKDNYFCGKAIGVLPF